MPLTLAHRTLFRGLVGLWLAAATACTGWTAPGSPAAIDEVERLEPVDAGTYRLVGTEEDSRAGGVERVVETYVVEPAFDRGEVQRQLTTLDDGSGADRGWETEYRRAGAFRLRETAGPARWDWAPPLRTVAAPLRVGTAWTTAAGTTIPDVVGFRRVMKLEGRSRVVGTDTVAVGGTRVFAYVIDGTLTTTVADTNRVTQETTTLTTTTAGRAWFAPSRGRTVRSEVRTEVVGDAAGAGYTVIRRLEADRL